MIDPTQIGTPAVGSLEWWLARLGKRLDARQVPMSKLEDYYAGRQPLGFVSDSFRAAFGNRFGEFSSNFSSLVVNSLRQRLQVTGIRIGDNREGDTDAWDWWQANRLDAESQTAHTEALVKGISYVLVWPRDADGEPEATVESPLQVVVETEPGRSWKRRAALKRWLDDHGHYRAELYLPDGLYRFRSAQRAYEFSLPTWGSIAQWRPDDTNGRQFVPNKIGVVPIVPIVNRPRLTGPLVMGVPTADDGRSEIADVISNQDVINKHRADAVNTSDLAGYPQRWLKNFDVATDEKTGQPINPFEAGAAVQRMFILGTPDPDDLNPADPEFGQFPQADLAGFVALIQQEVQALGSISQTPYHYLLPQSGQPPSGESQKVAESGFDAKVGDSKLYKGEAWEEVFRLNFAWRGDARAKNLSAEVMWGKAESRAEAVHTDAMTKWKALGIPEEFIWEELGLSPQQIARIKALKALIAAAPPEPPATVTTSTEPSIDDMPMVEPAPAMGGN